MEHSCKMEPEKVIVQPPPPYKGVSKVKQTPMLVAVGVACVCATALFVVCIGGGMWIKQLKGQMMQGSSELQGSADGTENSESGFEKTIKVNIKVENEDKSMTDEVRLDKIQNEEVDLQHDEEGHLEYVTVMDYDTNIYGSYSVADDGCYIYHAGDHKYNSVEDLLDNVYDGDDREEVYKNSSTMDFEIDEKPVKDHSILPNNLQPYCKGRDVYWIRPMEQTCKKEVEHGRQKRAFYICFGGRWSYRRCCGCNCPRARSCGYFYIRVCIGGKLRWFG